MIGHRLVYIVVFSLGLAAQANAAARLGGRVLDLNGSPVPQVQVIFDRADLGPGATVVTVFTDTEGAFRFPGVYPEATSASLPVSVRALGYEQIDKVTQVVSRSQGVESIELTFVVRGVDNQAAVAPASAWLGRISDRTQKSKLIVDCIGCHQVPAPEVRRFAGTIADLHATDPALARTQSWNAIVKYMNYLSSWEFSRAQRNAGETPDANAVYSVDDGADVAAIMTDAFDDRLDSISGYAWGAPLITTADTAIWEYEVPYPNAIREALMLGDPAKLWIADVSSNRMFTIDVASGEQEANDVPSEVLMGPHSLHRGEDGSLWVAPFFNSIVAHLDMHSGNWQTWRLRTPDGVNPGIHDLSFGDEHELSTDAQGRVWYSDIVNNAVGYFDPRDGESRIWNAPPSPGREGPPALYGLIMTKDRSEVWYSQLNNGTFGGFDIEKEEYIGPFQLPDRSAGPRRITINDEDVMYIALYGSGQLAEFDTRARRMIGVYDLPDTGSAPYAATWDPVRRVVWIPTSNGDVIYRFDPATKAFGVLPLPREQAFLRMLDVDPATGVLISSYANIVDIVQGPRMALIVEPGDGAYPQKFAPVMPTAANARVPATGAAPTAAPSDGAKLVDEARCYACHHMTDTLLGPPYVAIAARHAPRKDAMTDVLARKIVAGGGGNWGLVPMVPNQWVSIEQARTMAEWILELAPE
jgi:streptogramin lyase/cytochrome c551/c552